MNSFRALTVIDPFTRECLAIEVGLTLRAEDAARESAAHGAGRLTSPATGNGMGVEFNWGTVDSNVGPTKNMTVAGNIDLGDGTGFVFTGSPFTMPLFHCPPQCGTTARTVFSDNEALNDAIAGFKVTVNTDLGPGLVILENNLALGGGGGFVVNGGGQCENCQDPVGTGIVQLLGNVATQTAGVGFLAQLPGEISGNTASYNSVAGFLIVPGGAVFEHNSAVGNAGPGVLIDWSSDSITPVAGNFKTFSLNNLFGNDRNRPVISLFWGAQLTPNGYNPGPSAHCGILNVGAVAAVLVPGEGPPPPTPLAANYDYWGRALRSESLRRRGCHRWGMRSERGCYYCEVFRCHSVRRDDIALTARRRTE